MSEKVDLNRVQLYTGKSRACCFSSCVVGGTPLGIVISFVILNLPLALLIAFDVIKLQTKPTHEVPVDLVQVEKSLVSSVLMHMLLALAIVLLVISNVLICKTACKDPGIIPSRLWNLQKFSMPIRYRANSAEGGKR